MAELVDALVSGTSKRKFVQVRFLSWAPKITLGAVVAVRDYIICCKRLYNILYAQVVELVDTLL